jgi:Zn-dependent protease with chaperone function
MDFFEAQARARQRTTRLVVLFALAVTGTIALTYGAAMVFVNANRSQHTTEELAWFDPAVLAIVAFATLTVVGGASLYKWSQFRGGGAVVAEGVGARRVNPHTTDLNERRLLNVVEEMAIAAGLPVPAVYVLDEETSLNAFAAGLTTSDAVVTVTRGTLEKLNRDELQGVIGHEFSHILNGDMRLNVRLAAILFGILVIGLIGRGVLRGLGRGRVRVRGKSGGGAIAVILAIGLAMMIIGYVGYFFGRLIQAAVSRQREYLADASSVQFTRNPGGIAGALRKIGGYALGSQLANHQAAGISHFFFAEGFPAMFFGGLWATHPPLDTRIRAVDPQWDGKFFDPETVVDVRPESFQSVGNGPPPLPEAEAVRRAYHTPAGVPPLLPPVIALAPAAAMAQIGSVTSQHVDYARAMIDATPARLRDAARVTREAPALVYGLLLDPNEEVGEKQTAILTARAGRATADLVRELRPHFAQLAAATRLPLAQLTLPALRQLPPAELSVFAGTCQALIEADAKLSYFEFAVQRVLLRHLQIAQNPSATSTRFYSFNAVAGDIAVLLSALAWAGALHGPEQADGSVTADAAAATAAFRDGAGQLKLVETQLTLLPPEACAFSAVETALDHLAGASLPIKQRLLLGCAHTVSYDNQIRAEEGELLRAFADSLGCPMPPLLAGL